MRRYFDYAVPIGIGVTCGNLAYYVGDAGQLVSATVTWVVTYTSSVWWFRYL